MIKSVLTQEDKKMICDAMSELNKQSCELFDANMPSLHIWVQFQKYLMKIINGFYSTSKRDKLSEIYKLLDLETFEINAFEKEQISLKRLNDYKEKIYKEIISDI